MKFLHMWSSCYLLAEVESESVLCLKMVSETERAGWSFQLESFVYGHHVYCISWTPSFSTILLVKTEPTNKYDQFAVVVLKDREVVGHVPQEMSKVTSFFLGYDGNVMFFEVTGERLNHRVQLRLEVPCVYKFMAVRLIQIN